MTRLALWNALSALGRRTPGPVSIVLGGSAALILSNDLPRPTDDGDIVASEPGVDELQSLIREIANSEGLPPGWLNGSIQSYTYVLPSDYSSRLVSLPPFNRLRVRLLSRRDVILMKVYSMRPRDIDDLHSIHPAPDELAFVRAQLSRIAAREADKAREMAELLDEWRT